MKPGDIVLRTEGNPKLWSAWVNQPRPGTYGASYGYNNRVRGCTTSTDALRGLNARLIHLHWKALEDIRQRKAEANRERRRAAGIPSWQFWR